MDVSSHVECVVQLVREDGKQRTKGATLQEGLQDGR